MRIAEFLVSPARLDIVGPVDMDALTETDALLEAALLEVSLDVTTGETRLLFDCRGALQIRGGNTAIVVVRGVSEFRWTTVARERRTWQAVMSWEPRPHPSGLAISAALAPDADLHVIGSGGEFYVGDIPGGDEPPPNFASASPEEIRRGLASWSSDIDVLGASYR